MFENHSIELRFPQRTYIFSLRSICFSLFKSKRNVALHFSTERLLNQNDSKRAKNACYDFKMQFNIDHLINIKKYALKYFIFSIIIISFFSCKKEESQQLPDKTTYDSLDVGIQFKRYAKGVPYLTDTIQNEFWLINNSSYELKKGDVFKTACELGGTVFSLDLLGKGPTDIVLTQNLLPGDSFSYNPGYLLRQSMLDYFAVDTLDICVMVYGVNDIETPPSFNQDPFPDNNKACIRIFDGGLIAE